MLHWLFAPFGCLDGYAQLLRGKTLDAKELVHPEVGPLSLPYQAFDVREAQGAAGVVFPGR